jgi:hypothetical protein
MLTSAELSDMERLIGFTGALPKKEARQLIAAYRDVLLSTPHLDAPVYNPLFGDDKLCGCGHGYYRHFDTHGDMAPVGCKYCECKEFVISEAAAPKARRDRRKRNETLDEEA